MTLQSTASLYEYLETAGHQDTLETALTGCFRAIDSLFESKKAVVKFLEEHDPEFAAEVRDRLAYIDKFKTAHEYGDAMVHGDLKHISGLIQEC